MGKYFFFNSKTGSRSWIPPESVLSNLVELFEANPGLKQNLFDPFNFEDEEIEEELSGADEVDDHSSEDVDGSSEQVSLNDNKMNNEAAEDEFKIYLMKNSIDPFAPWPTILSLHGASPQFLAVPSDKRRQEIFSQLCPLLIEAKRAEKAKKIEEARSWWTECIKEPVAKKMSWFLLLKRIKDSQKHSKMFSLLNEKDCEKEYKNLISKN
ncbi:MAG: hypothetical protein EBU93_07170 [Chlamydiae bacterium]|nr:hypothetical protein [Chlamydiota bacterium]